MAADANASPAEMCSTAAVLLGLVSLATCWWFPFGPTLGGVGTGFGIVALGIGPATIRAVVGTTLAAFGAAAGLILAGNYWQRTLGW